MRICSEWNLYAVPLQFQFNACENENDHDDCGCVHVPHRQLPRSLHLLRDRKLTFLGLFDQVKFARLVALEAHRLKQHK